MYRSVPVATYFSRSCGSVFKAKCAQCVQPSDAYSITVTGASATPSSISGKYFGVRTAAPKGASVFLSLPPRISLQTPNAALQAKTIAKTAMSFERTDIIEFSRSFRNACHYPWKTFWRLPANICPFHCYRSGTGHREDPCHRDRRPRLWGCPLSLWYLRKPRVQDYRRPQRTSFLQPKECAFYVSKLTMKNLIKIHLRVDETLRPNKRQSSHHLVLSDCLMPHPDIYVTRPDADIA